jgi:predicted lipoprotein
MKKLIITGAIILIIILLAFLSLDIRRLDRKKNNGSETTFNPEMYASDLWENNIPECISKAIQLTDLKQMLKDNPEETLSKYGHQLGISQTYYFYLKGSGSVEKISDEQVEIQVDTNTKAGLAILFIFGNAVRDGSGLVNINNFLNMMDFNSISVLLNKKVKNEVVKPITGKIKKGMTLEFTGAVEISSDSYNPDFWSVIPLQIKLNNGK